MYLYFQHCSIQLKTIVLSNLVLCLTKEHLQLTDFLPRLRILLTTVSEVVYLFYYCYILLLLNTQWNLYRISSPKPMFLLKHKSLIILHYVVRSKFEQICCSLSTRVLKILESKCIKLGKGMFQLVNRK